MKVWLVREERLNGMWYGAFSSFELAQEQVQALGTFYRDYDFKIEEVMVDAEIGAAVHKMYYLDVNMRDGKRRAWATDQFCNGADIVQMHRNKTGRILSIIVASTDESRLEELINKELGL